VELYEQAISVLPTCAPLHTNLAAALAQAANGARQYDAVMACDTAIKIDQAFVKARVRRGGCLSALGRHDEVRTILSNMLCASVCIDQALF
jgi:hypothetical protein